jgi:hypothetical protein
MREVAAMRTRILLVVLLAITFRGVGLEAKELVLSPLSVGAITSPVEARDSRVLLYFDLPGRLCQRGVVVESATLVFQAEVRNAEYGLIQVFPVITAWRSAPSLAWNSPWTSPGGDFATNVAGKCVTLKQAKGMGTVISNVTFVVKDWLAGRLPNNGLIIVPSGADLEQSSATFSFDRGSFRLKIEWVE